MIVAIMGALTSRAAGPLASVLCLVLAMALLGQCSAAGSAKRALAASEKRLVASQRDLGTCRLNVAERDASIDRQNEAVAALERASEARVAEIAKARQVTRKEAERADAAAAQLAKVKPVGIDQCARLLDVDARVREITQ